MFSIFKIAFLFLAVWWGFVNVGKVIYREPVPADNILIMAVGIVGFLVMQFGLYN